MSLAQKLKAVSEGAAKQVPADKLAIMKQYTEDLRESGIVDGVIKVGHKLPPFALMNQAGETVRSDDILARGPMVLSNFRGVW